MELRDWITEEIQESIAVKTALGRDAVEVISRIASLIIERLKAGNKVILFGNGGSAADAQHIAAELVGRYRFERLGLPAMALTTNTSLLTALGNDYSFEEIFAQQITALGRAGDIAVAISTSGNSANVLRALEAAKQKGLHTVALGGQSGGAMKSLAEICLCVPSNATPRVQEAHILVGHIICAVVERAFSTDASRGSK